MNIKHFKYLRVIIITMVIVSTGCEDSNEKIEEKIANTSFIPFKYGKFEYNDYEPLSDKPITVYTYMPDYTNDDIPVIFVMHGQNRDASNYCGDWATSAEKYKILIVCPEINELYYPNSQYYQQGGMFIDNKFTEPEKWTFNLIDNIFSTIQDSNVTKAKTYGIYGHSGGGQFVHRFALFSEPKNASIIIPSNSGWYTLAHYKETFPYGLNNSPLNENILKEKFLLPLVILLGENDTDPNSSSLRKTDEAMRQGSHRYARGKYFYTTAKSKAEELSLQFNWKVFTVPNVGHSNAGMAPSAAEQFYKTLSNN